MTTPLRRATQRLDTAISPCSSTQQTAEPLQTLYRILWYSTREEGHILTPSEPLRNPCRGSDTVGYCRTKVLVRLSRVQHDAVAFVCKHGVSFTVSCCVTHAQRVRAPPSPPPPKSGGIHSSQPVNGTREGHCHLSEDSAHGHGMRRREITGKFSTGTPSAAQWLSVRSGAGVGSFSVSSVRIDHESFSRPRLCGATSKLPGDFHHLASETRELEFRWCARSPRCGPCCSSRRPRGDLSGS